MILVLMILVLMILVLMILVPRFAEEFFLSGATRRHFD
jgi:hypothetical protein